MNWLIRGAQWLHLSVVARPSFRWPTRRGQGLVEFALIAPLATVLLLGAIDFGRVMYGYVAVNSAVQAGAEFAARTQTFTSTLVDPVILTESGGFLTSSNTSPSTVTVVNGTSVEMAVVTVTYTFHPLFPVPPIPSSIQMTVTQAAPVAAL